METLALLTSQRMTVLNFMLLVSATNGLFLITFESLICLMYFHQFIIVFIAAPLDG